MKTIKELLRGVDIIAQAGDLEKGIAGVTNDSRKVEKDWCFIAIQGYQQDGLKYVDEAINRGANSVVSQHKLQKDYPGLSWAQVKNDRLAFSKMTANLYDRVADHFYNIGVTGTNGKTTITALLSAILNREAKTAQIGTLGMRCGETTWGASLTTPEAPDIFRFLSETRAQGAKNLVMEVSSVSLCLYRVEDIKFSQAIFTSFSGDHLDFHKTMEDYLASKILLFKKLQEDDWAVINIDDPTAPIVIQQLNCKYLTYGFSTEADIRPLKYKFSIGGPYSIEALLMTPKGQLEIKSHLIGRINLSNLMAAVTSAMIKGISFNDIAAAIAEFKPVKGRLDFAYKGDFSVLIDYAHTDKALEALLQSLREMVTGRLIAVFGAGGNRDKTKRPRMGETVSQNADFLVVTSDNPRQEDPSAIIREIQAGFAPGFKNFIIEIDRETAIEKALDMAVKGDLVVVAGKGHENYQIFKDRTIHFDDYEVVQKLMEKRKKENHA
ncbi:MAG: UDP-N-acetylmuramoyl-L-alanyl-D-glutamate--2,6-diaminopimelate ligase [Acidobacteriota bacterium]|nr:UDP-N-acetylmuramoyl-L-alanyl-D-glutamate--2,6-diaminopimelate ligase [Acidobacteriota bacterium]